MACLALSAGVAACGDKGDGDNGDNGDNGASSSSTPEISSPLEESSSEVVDNSSEDSSSEVVEDSSIEEVVDSSSEESFSSMEDDSSESEYLEDYYTEGLVFTLLNDDMYADMVDTYAVTDYIGTATEVVIPSVYDGKAVTGIDYRAFTYCDSLTEIVIPDSVTNIGMAAFTFCRSLTEIIIPDSVTSVDHEAFNGCNNLTIYCEAESQPSDWDSDWNLSNCPVVWGYKGE